MLSPLLFRQRTLIYVRPFDVSRVFIRRCAWPFRTRVPHRAYPPLTKHRRLTTPIIILIPLLIITTMMPSWCSGVARKREDSVHADKKPFIVFPVFPNHRNNPIYDFILSFVTRKRLETPKRLTKVTKSGETICISLRSSFLICGVLNRFFVFVPIDYHLISPILFIHPKRFHTPVYTFDKVHNYFLD